jgi:hypothetical protein
MSPTPPLVSDREVMKLEDLNSANVQYHHRQAFEFFFFPITSMKIHEQ